MDNNPNTYEEVLFGLCSGPIPLAHKSSIVQWHLNYMTIRKCTNTYDHRSVKVGIPYVLPYISTEPGG